jgi:membrane protein YdbS with pleckstrin-like domain
MNTLPENHIAINMSTAIGDITKLLIALALLIAAGAGGLTYYFVNTHFGLFLLFAGITLLCVVLAIVVWLVLPDSAAEVFEPLHDDERIGQRTSTSWRPPES